MVEIKLAPGGESGKPSLLAGRAADSDAEVPTRPPGLHPVNVLFRTERRRRCRDWLWFYALFNNGDWYRFP